MAPGVMENGAGAHDRGPRAGMATNASRGTAGRAEFRGPQRGEIEGMDTRQAVNSNHGAVWSEPCAIWQQ